MIRRKKETMRTGLGVYSQQHFLSKERTCAKTLLQAKAFTKLFKKFYQKRFAGRDKKEEI
jgi:uncharacterized membrane-anchored protein YjiN (DUF445 family)